MERVGLHDTDKNGWLTADEWAQNRKLNERSSSIDANGDGCITPRELALADMKR